MATALTQARFDEGGRAYESQQNVFLNTGISGGSPTNNLPSGRTATHNGGGLADNSTTNSNTDTVTLTTGGSSYTLTRTVFDCADRVIAIGADNTAVSTMSYDGANRTIVSTDPLGNNVSTIFDSNGNAVQQISTEISTITQPAQTPELFTNLMAYDCLNRMVLQSQPGPDGSIASVPNVNMARITLYGNDSRGNRTLSIDPNGNTALTTFDGASRAIEAIQHLRQESETGMPLVLTRAAVQDEPYNED